MQLKRTEPLTICGKKTKQNKTNKKRGGGGGRLVVVSTQNRKEPYDVLKRI